MADNKPADTPQSTPANTPTPEQLEASKLEFKNAFVDNPRFTRGMNQEGKRRAAAPPPEPDPAPAPPEPEPTSSDDEPPKEPVTPPVDAPVDEPPPAPAADKSNGDREPVVIPKSTDTPPTAPPTDDEARINAEVARRMRELGIEPPTSGAAAPPATPPPTKKSVNVDEQQLAVLRELESMNPRYVGIAERAQEFWELDATYRRNWIAQNPGKKFDPNSDEHAEFYSANEPRFSQRDFQAAQRSIERKEIAAQVRDEVVKEFQPEIERLRATAKMQQVQPKIERAAREAEALVMSGVPDFEKIMDAGDGSLVLSRDTDTKMQEINPVLHARASELAEETMVIVSELEKMNELGPAYPLTTDKKEKLPSGETIRPHAVIVDVLDSLEERYANTPKDQVRNGKLFLTMAERAQKIEAINSMNIPREQKVARLRALEQSHWCVSSADIKKEAIERARTKLSSLSKKIKSRAPATPPAAAPKKGETGRQVAPPKPPAPASSSSSSDTTTSSDNVDVTHPAARGSRGTAKSFADLITR